MSNKQSARQIDRQSARQSDRLNKDIIFSPINDNIPTNNVYMQYLINGGIKQQNDQLTKLIHQSDKYPPLGNNMLYFKKCMHVLLQDLKRSQLSSNKIIYMATIIQIINQYLQQLINYYTKQLEYQKDIYMQKKKINGVQSKYLIALVHKCNTDIPCLIRTDDYKKSVNNMSVYNSGQSIDRIKVKVHAILNDIPLVDGWIQPALGGHPAVFCNNSGGSSVTIELFEVEITPL